MPPDAQEDVSGSSKAENPSTKDLAPEQRLELSKARFDLIKFLAGSVAVVLITAWLSHIIKQREQSLKEVTQDYTNLKDYADFALKSSPEKQVRLAEFWENLSRDDGARGRWKAYHEVVSRIRDAQVSAAKRVDEIEQLVKTAGSEPEKKRELEKQLRTAVRELENVASLAAPTSAPDTLYNTPVLDTPSDVQLSDGWLFRVFDGGDLAAKHLSEPDQCPPPENIYATVVAPDERSNWILVWWKRGSPKFTYQYRGVSWDRFNPGNFDLPTPKEHRVPISLGGRGYQQFLFFQGTPVAASPSPTSTPVR